MSEAPLASEALNQPHYFPCTQCAASLEYAPGTEVLRCTHCGYENQVSASNEPILEQDFKETLRNLERSAANTERIAIHCKSCGATYSLGAADHAGDCPFCGTPAVADSRLGLPIAGQPSTGPVLRWRRPDCHRFPRRTLAGQGCEPTRRPSCVNADRCHWRRGESRPGHGESALRFRRQETWRCRPTSAHCRTGC